MNDMFTYFATLHEPSDIIEVRFIWPDRTAGHSPQSTWLSAADWQDAGAAALLADKNEEGWNIYAGVLPRIQRGARGNDKTLPAAHLWADIDHVTPAEAGKRLIESGLPHPGLIVNTGHGIQCYWLLKEKRRPDELRTLVGDLAVFLGSDTAVKNEERVLRVPGFINHKPPVADAELLECHPDLRYDFDAIRELVPVAAPAAPAAVVSASSQLASGDHTNERARRYLAMIPGAGPGGRTNTAFRAAAVMVKDYGLDSATALDLLTRWDAASNMPPIQADPQYGPDELARIVANAGKYGKHQVGAFLEEHGAAMAAPPTTTLARPMSADAEKDPRRARIEDPGTLPRTLLDAPGYYLPEFLEFILRTSIRPQPELALGASISSLGTITARLVEGVTGLRTNTYVLGVVPSGDGKNRPMEAIRLFLQKADMEHLYFGDRLKSDAGIRSALSVNPCGIYLIDEIGEWLVNIKNAKTSPWLKNIITELLMLYSSAHISGIKMGGYADAKSAVTVDCPHVCLFGTSVPESFFQSMTMSAITGGLLGRFLVFESSVEFPHKQRNSREDIPAGLLEFAEKWRNFKPNGNLTGNFPGSTCAPFLIEESREATQIFDRIEEIARAEFTQLPREYFGPFKRTEENARKLALLAACSESFDKPYIGVRAASWASELSLYLTRRLIYLASMNVADNEVHDKRNRVFKIINDTREQGIERATLTSRCRFLRARELSEILDTLAMSNEIVVEKLESLTRPKIKYYSMQYRAGA